jgi:hypothetical protein
MPKIPEQRIFRENVFLVIFALFHAYWRKGRAICGRSAAMRMCLNDTIPCDVRYHVSVVGGLTDTRSL